MWFEDFKAGHWRKQYQYRSFSPTLVNHEWRWRDARIGTLLEQASRALGELNGFSRIVPDVGLFIRMHVVKEATMSSRIEGTQTSIGEALRAREQIAPEKRDDWQEVQNYIAAMSWAIDELTRLPLSNRLLLKTHEILMQGVRGEHKTPGEFRRSQNWIGGTNLQTAVFVPPTADEVPDLMSDLEKFWHNEGIDVPDLIRIAISHYQFETIHPFLDGNGRIGRLLITLYLVSKGLLDQPTLYLSAYLERHKGAYYDALTTVRATNDLGHWVRFFLAAVHETAREGCTRLRQILDLHNESFERVATLGKKVPNARRLLRHLYKQPTVTAADVERQLGVSRQTANVLLQDLRRLGLLEETTGLLKKRIYVFDSYARLFQE